MDRVYASFPVRPARTARTTSGPATILFGCRIEIDPLPVADTGLTAPGAHEARWTTGMPPRPLRPEGCRYGCEGPSDPQLEEEILKSKRAIVTLLALVVATVGAACGASDDTTTSEPAATTAAPAASDTAAAAPSMAAGPAVGCGRDCTRPSSNGARWPHHDVLAEHHVRLRKAFERTIVDHGLCRLRRSLLRVGRPPQVCRAISVRAPASNFVAPASQVTCISCPHMCDTGTVLPSRSAAVVVLA